jgi:hypothetical protein
VGSVSHFFHFALLSSPSAAQQNGAPVGLTPLLDETKLSVLTGTIPPLARPEFDRGPAPLYLPLDRMLLVLQRNPKQETALGIVLNQQQDKSSANYHKWLTPVQFGQQFGPSDQDISAVTSWLVSHGFQVNRVANGRMVIEFSGTAAQVQEALHTEIHEFHVNGKDHWANSTDPQIPSALASVVSGIVSLHNFPRKPLHRVMGVFSRSRGAGNYQLSRPLSQLSPLFTGGAGCGLAGGPCYGLAPYDLATIYNVLPIMCCHCGIRTLLLTAPAKPSPSWRRGHLPLGRE